MSYSWLVDVIVEDILDAVDDDFEDAIAIVDAIRAAIEEEEGNTDQQCSTLNGNGKRSIGEED